MAVITIPSSFSPIAAAIDVFTQDRLAQQKRARQAEQDAWNLEARDRQRENWGHIDQERAYQQQQRDIAAQAQAEQEAKAASWTPDIGMTALTGMIPEQVATGRVHPNLPSRKSTQEELYNALETHQAKWPGAAQISPAGIAKLYGPQQEAISFREFGETLEAARSGNPQQRDLALFQLMKSKEDGGYGLNVTQVGMYLRGDKSSAGTGKATQGPLDTTELKRLMDIAANRAVSVGQGGVLGAGATGFGTGLDEFAGTGPSPALFSPEDQASALSRAHEMLEGRTGQSYSDFENIWAPKEDEVKPLTLSSVGESGLTQGGIKSAYEGMFDPRGEELSKIASVLQAGLQQYGGVGNLPLADSQGSNLGTTGDVTGATQDLIMRNMWQAAQILHNQNPTTSARAIFENLMENIGYGDRGVDVLGIEESMVSPYKEGLMPVGLSDTMASYRAGIGEQGGPTLKSPQEIAADYQALLAFSQRHQ